MPYRVVFTPESQDDLHQLYLFIAETSGENRALSYIGRIESFCRGFADFPERGTRRDDLFPGLRLTGFERRVTLAFHISGDLVVFDRILYGGRDIGALSGES